MNEPTLLLDSENTCNLIALHLGVGEDEQGISVEKGVCCFGSRAYVATTRILGLRDIVRMKTQYPWCLAREIHFVHHSSAGYLYEMLGFWENWDLCRDS